MLRVLARVTSERGAFRNLAISINVKIREGKYVVTGDYGEIYYEYNLDEKVQKKKSAKDERRKRKLKKKTRNPFLPSSVQIHPLLLLPRVLLR